MREVLDAMSALLGRGERGALATVTAASGSTPQTPGARLLLTEDGALFGTVGGGAIEAEVVRALAQCLKDGRPLTLQRDLGRDLGMCCGGRMTIFIESIESPPRLVIFGAGHVAMPTAQMARMVGFHVLVVDDREDLNTAERFPECERHLAEPVEASGLFEPTNADWMLITTHDHRIDEEALDHFARGPHRYIGMIGSKRKVFRILHRISRRTELPPLDKVYSPVGLPLGAVSPAEIGASIVAELVALRHGQEVPHKRAIDDPRLARVLRGELTPEAASRIDS